MMESGMEWQDFMGDRGLHDMCRYAAENANGKTVKFEVFNKEERDRVHEIMKLYPHVDFFCTWIAPRPAP